MSVESIDLQAQAQCPVTPVITSLSTHPSGAGKVGMLQHPTLHSKASRSLEVTAMSLLFCRSVLISALGSAGFASPIWNSRSPICTPVIHPQPPRGSDLQGLSAKLPRVLLYCTFVRLPACPPARLSLLTMPSRLGHGDPAYA